MANDFKQSINEAKTDIDSLIPHLKAVEKEVIRISGSIRKNMKGAFKGTPNGANNRIKQELKEMEQFQRAMKKQYDEQLREMIRLNNEKNKARAKAKAQNEKRLKDLETFQRRMQEQRAREEAAEIASNKRSLAAQKKKYLEEQRMNKKRMDDMEKFQAAMRKQRAQEERAAAKRAEAARSYNRLIASEQRARKALQDLIATGRRADETQKQFNKRLKIAQQNFDRYAVKVQRANRATSRFARSGSGSLGKLQRGFQSLLGAAGIVGVSTAIVDLGRNVFREVKKLESLRFTLKTVTEGTAEYIRINEFLEDITVRYGAALVSTTERYTKFYTAARQSNLSMKDTEDIFRSVTKAAGVMGLKTDELNGVYLALEQMLSKGKVTTEELRRQLGERLPGAFGIMADAVGVSVSELDKMLKKGEIISSVELPKFAKELEKAYGIENVNRIDTLNAAQNRLSTSWTLFIKHIDEDQGVLSNFFKNFIDGTTGMIGALDTLSVASEGFWDMMVKMGRVAISPAYAATIGAEAAIKVEKKKQKDLSLELAQLQAEQAQEAITMTDEFDTATYIKERQLELEKLSSRELMEQIENIREQKRLRGEIIEEETGFRIGSLGYLREKLKLEKESFEAAVSDESRAHHKAEMDRLEKEIELLEGKKKTEIEYLEGSIGYLEEKISKNDELLKQATSDAERQKYRNENEELTKQLELLTKKREYQTGIAAPKARGAMSKLDFDVSQLEGEIQREKDPFKKASMQRRLDGMKDVQASVPEHAQGTIEGATLFGLNKTYLDQIDKAMDDYLKKIEITEAREEEQAEKRNDRLNKLAATLDFVGGALDGLAGIGTGIIEHKIQKLEEEMELNQVKYDEEVAYIEQTAASEEEAERKKAILKEEKEKKDALLQQKIKKEKKKQAIIDKANALAQAGIGTALAIISALQTQPFLPLGPAMATLAAVLGGIQIAAIAATPLPQYAEGTGFHKGGPAILGDGGKAEAAILPSGKVIKSASTDTIYNLPRGTVVEPDFNEYMAERLKPVFDLNFLKDVVMQQVEDEYAKKTWEAIKENTNVLRHKKFNGPSVKTQRVDMAHEFYRMRNMNWNN